MAMSQSEAAKLSNDLLLRGVIETIVKESSLLQYLPFMNVTGTAVRYNREASMPAASFYSVNDTWAEAAPTFTSVTATLKILGGDADVDNFLQATYADTNDIEAEVIASRAKAVAHKYMETFFTGDEVDNDETFNGLHNLVPSAQSIYMGANGDEPSFEALDELIDMVRPGKPDVLLMAKRTRRQLKALRRSDGISTEMHLNEFGQQVETYDGIPILVDDFCPVNEDRGSAEGECTSIWALRFGMNTGLMGLQHGGITVERVGELETKDATRHRIKWYCGLALFSELGVARLGGILES